MINKEEILNKFLSSILQKRWAERYHLLIKSKKGQKKFLMDLYHTFNDRINNSKIANEK